MIRKYYLSSVLYPSIISIIVGATYAAFDEGSYIEEYDTASSVFIEAAFYTLLFCSVGWIISLGIFFNKIQQIKNNKLLRSISWFLMPFAISIWYVFHEITTRIKFGVFNEYVISMLIIIIPFLVALILSYSKYSREQFGKNE
ncbi:MAG: hypothetical protein COB85_01145 [Bacteroidetes bacterium]|nr:MAG: hypothetical protein COB85_01145 [Bacteroidota bacterium]